MAEGKSAEGVQPRTKHVWYFVFFPEGTETTIASFTRNGMAGGAKDGSCNGVLLDVRNRLLDVPSPSRKNLAVRQPGVEIGEVTAPH